MNLFNNNYIRTKDIPEEFQLTDWEKEQLGSKSAKWGGFAFLLAIMFTAPVLGFFCIAAGFVAAIVVAWAHLQLTASRQVRRNYAYHVLHVRQKRKMRSALRRDLA